MSSPRDQPPRRAPEPEVSLRTENPLALISAARLALRRAGKDRSEIDRFTRAALASSDPAVACSRYLRSEPSD